MGNTSDKTVKLSHQNIVKFVIARGFHELIEFWSSFFAPRDDHITVGARDVEAHSLGIGLKFIR